MPSAFEIPSTPAPIQTSVNPRETPKSRHQPTTELLEKQKQKQHIHCSGRKFVSRSLSIRIKQQNAELSRIAEEIYHGSKEDLKEGITHGATVASWNKLQNESSILTPQDIVDIAKQTYGESKGKTVYDTLVTDESARKLHISNLDILKIQDAGSQRDAFRTLRRKLPAFFDSERQVDKLRQKWHEEFEVVLQPIRFATGRRIDPKRLQKCLGFIYPLLK